MFADLLATAYKDIPVWRVGHCLIILLQGSGIRLLKADAIELARVRSAFFDVDFTSLSGITKVTGAFE